MFRERLSPPLLYARVWEDDAILRRALRITPGDRVFSIASAGENALALLLDDPAEVVALDRNTTQLALIHLKLACLAELSPHDGRRFLGFEDAPAAERMRTYRALRGRLPKAARDTFDSAPTLVGGGLLHAGKFERYLTLFRRVVLRLVQSPDVVREMTALRELPAQRALYRARWDSWAWRALFRVFFGRQVMQRLGRERAFFEHVTKGEIGDVFRARAEKALCELPVADNPYLMWILTGTSAPPVWLDERTAPLIAARADRVRVVEGDLATHMATAPRRHYAAFNLSDCFEYLSTDATGALLRSIADAGSPGARLAYWNLLVARDATLLPERFEAEVDLARALFAEDRAFFYGRLVVERVR